jgi:RND superfamily putative drug exporter
VSLLSLSVNPDIVVRLIATSLAAGILLDVVVVRTALVPALVDIMGKWNWWLPPGWRACYALRRALRRPLPGASDHRSRCAAPKRWAATPIILR